jgi:hypothetical protein
MISTAYTIGTTAVKLVSTSVNQREISLHVIGTGVVYLGGSTVTAANGMLTEKNAVPFTFTLPANNELWAITATGTEEVRVMVPSNMSGV